MTNPKSSTSTHYSIEHTEKLINHKLPSIPKNKIYVIALCLITLSSFGNNYAFNNPQALT